MPLYDVTDTDSGMTLTLEGDSPPNEQELEEIFRQLKPAQATEPEKPKPGPIELAARARGAVAPMTEEARVAGEKPLVEDLVPWQVNAAASLGVPGAKTVQAVTGGLTKPIAAMTSPTGAALTAATIAMPQIGIPLGIGMGAVGLPSAYQKTREGIAEGNLEKTIEGLTEGGLSTGMLVGGVAGIGGLLARKPVLPMTSREAAIPTGEPALEPIALPEAFQPIQLAPVAMPPKLAAVEQAKRRAAIKEARPMGVPETPTEAQRGMSAIEEIRQAGADTKEKVRALFPQISREEAGRLRDLAFPREKVPDNLSKADVERLFLEPEQARTEAELAEARPVAEETPKAPLTQDELVGQKLGGITHLVPIITRLSKVYREQGPEAGRGYLEMMASEAPESSGFKQEVETPGFIDSLDNRIRSELGLEQTPKVEAQPAVPEPPKEPAPPPVTPTEQAELRADLAAEMGEKPTSEIKGINWDAYYEDLVGDLDAFAPARTSGRRSYEMDDVADRFVTFVRKDKTGRTPLDLVKEFAQQDKATTTQIRKLQASVKNLEKTTQPTPVEPTPESAPVATTVPWKSTPTDEMFAAPMWTEKYKGMTQSIRDLRERAKDDPVAAIRLPGYDQLSTVEKQDLLAHGFTFTVDRMGKPLLKISQEAKADTLRRRVTEQAALRQTQETIAPVEPPKTETAPEPSPAPTVAPEKAAGKGEAPPVSHGPGAAGAGEMKDLGAATPASIPSAPSNFRHWYDVHIGRPGAKLAPTVKRLWNTGSVRHAIATLKDWSENSARLFSRSQANDIRKPLRRLAKKDFKVADNALSMVVEAKGSYEALQEMRLKLTSSTQADPWWRKQALDALDYATYHWDELSKLAKDYKGITKAQVGIENASDIPTLEREGYVPHRQEIEELDLLTKTGQGGSTFFEKPRVYETFADSIAAGVDPKKLSATDLLEHRLNSGMRLVNSRKWMDSLRQLKDPETKAPIATNLKPLVRADGSKVMVPPTGYVAEIIGPHSVAILKGYEGIFSALTDPSFFTKRMAGRAFLTANATGKSLRLLFDTFHLGRVAFWLSLIKSLGVRTFKAPFPTYRRGVTLLDFTTNQIQEMAKAGEIPQRWLNNLLEDKRRLDLAVKSGYNVGRISDALYQDLIHSIPGLGTFNKWLFDQFQRGAMSEAWLLEFERAKRASPGYSEAELAKQVSYALNVRFGNLGRQGWFKSRSFQDIARMIALAPQWNEALIKSEWGAVREAGQFVRDAATGRRIYAGILIRSVGGMALMQFIANQVLNQATRGKFTWENPEEGWGAKISAWIPDVTGNGPGFFLHPLGLAAETVHLLTNLYERSGGDTAKVATDYLRSRSSAIMGPILAGITRSDFLGRKFKPGTVWWEVAKTAIPVPIAGGALFAAGKQIVTGQPSEQFAGQYQKQAMASMGVRTESAPSPGQRIARLAAEWRREKGILSNEAFYGTGDYQPLVQALRIGNLATAKQEIVKLRKTHTDAEIRQHFSRWQRAPFTGSHAREREFRRQLTPKQEIAYIKARNERARVSSELRKLLR